MNFVDLTKQCSIDETAAFLNTTQSFLDEAEFVERYSWFGTMKGANVVNPVCRILFLTDFFFLTSLRTRISRLWMIMAK